MRICRRKAHAGCVGFLFYFRLHSRMREISGAGMLRNFRNSSWSLGQLFELAVPAMHVFLGESGILHHGDPFVFGHCLFSPENLVHAKQLQDHVLMILECFDFVIELGEPALENRSQAVAGGVEDCADLIHADPDRPVKLDLFQRAKLTLAVETVVGRGTNGRLQQADRLVVQHRAPTEIATFRKLRDCVHGHEINHQPCSCRRVKEIRASRTARHL